MKVPGDILINCFYWGVIWVTARTKNKYECSRSIGVSEIIELKGKIHGNNTHHSDLTIVPQLIS